jgi:hypothetical protein
MMKRGAIKITWAMNSGAGSYYAFLCPHHETFPEGSVFALGSEFSNWKSIWCPRSKKAGYTYT